MKREINDKTLNKIFDYKGESVLENAQKFSVGRLLQAGWFSLTSTKTLGIEKAFQLTPAIRQEFLDLTENHRHQMPKIFADFFLLLLSDFSFRSGFLKTELKSYYESLDALATPQNVLARVPLLWALKPFLDHQEFNEIVARYAKSLEDTPNITAEEKASSLVLLRAINMDDKNMKKVLTKKLQELNKAQPGVFSKLLPTKKPGFRK